MPWIGFFWDEARRGPFVPRGGATLPGTFFVCAPGSRPFFPPFPAPFSHSGQNHSVDARGPCTVVRLCKRVAPASPVPVPVRMASCPESPISACFCVTRP